MGEEGEGGRGEVGGWGWGGGGEVEPEGFEDEVDRGDVEEAGGVEGRGGGGGGEGEGEAREDSFVEARVGGARGGVDEVPEAGAGGGSGGGGVMGSHG